MVAVVVYAFKVCPGHFVFYRSWCGWFRWSFDRFSWSFDRFRFGWGLRFILRLIDSKGLEPVEEKDLSQIVCGNTLEL